MYSEEEFFVKLIFECIILLLNDFLAGPKVHLIKSRSSQPVAKQNCVGINISEGRILKLGTLLLRGTCFYLSNAIYTCILQTQCKKNNIETW